MDAMITAAARLLAGGDLLGALKRVALRDDPPALALRGIAMAQLGDLAKAKTLLKAAARGFGPKEPLARARCLVAEAEIALVSRDLTGPAASLGTARAVLQTHGDHVNAAHATLLEARRLLLIGRLEGAESLLAEMETTALPPASRAAHALVRAGIAVRRLRTTQAREALWQASNFARQAAIPALAAEVERAEAALQTPAARLVRRDADRPLRLEEVEAVLASGRLVVDACRNAVHGNGIRVSLATRPVLFTLLRLLGEGWPQDVARAALVAQAFRGKEADESHRIRLRVEIGRLRNALRPLADIRATRDGFRLIPLHARDVVVLAPPVDEPHGGVLALLADGESWSSSALSIALGVSPRTAQRALEALEAAGKVLRSGNGPSRRWTLSSLPGFPSTLLLPGPLPGD